MRQRRAGGYVGILVVGGYLVLRFAFIAYREHEEGMSTLGIVGTLAAFAVAVFLVSQIVIAVHRARTRARDRALQSMHPTAYLVPIAMKRDLIREVNGMQAMLGLAPTHVPRNGYATLVADGNGIGLYRGGATPELIVGLTRDVVQHVGTGRTKAGNRWGVGTVEALQVLVSTGAHWSTLDLPVYARVVGYARTLHSEELDRVVQRVASSAGVALAPTPRG